MGINGSPDFNEPGSLRRSIDDRLRNVSKQTGRTINELRREFVFQRFLALIFSTEHEHPWVLKGGGSLLVRLPNARFSRDLDLLHLEAPTPAEAVDELVNLTRPATDDQLRFAIDTTSRRSDANGTITVAVQASFGATNYERFNIDLAYHRHHLGTPDRIQPNPVVEVPGMPGLPEIALYPLSDHIADKVCAMYELHRNSEVSSRYRDLVDLVLISETSHVAGAATQAALRSEALRRGLTLPTALISPGPGWPGGYRREALRHRRGDIPTELTEALERVGRLINPLLNGTRNGGHWEPYKGWADQEPSR